MAHIMSQKICYADNKEGLHVEYFPSYSPELDPIEQSWRENKKMVGDTKLEY